MEMFEHYSIAELQGLEVLNHEGASLRDATRLWVPDQPMPARPAGRRAAAEAIAEPARKPGPTPQAGATPQPGADVPGRAPRERVTRNLWAAARRHSAKPAVTRGPRSCPGVPSPRGAKALGTKALGTRDRESTAPGTMLLLPEARSWLSGIRSVFDHAGHHQRLLYHDAVAVRSAVLSSPDPSRMVRFFVRESLQIRGVTEHVLNAVIDVLLAEDWPSSSLPDDQLRALLLTRTRERHRAHRPVLESRIRRMSIASLSADVITPAGHARLDQLIAGTNDTETEAVAVGMWEDKRLRSITGRLSADGRAIIEMFARFPGLSWAEAAELAGADHRRGEQLRRQVRHLAREINRREAGRTSRAGTASTR
jgi:hypothetical protein